jgi:hypothetical protein
LSQSTSPQNYILYNYYCAGWGVHCGIYKTSYNTSNLYNAYMFLLWYLSPFSGSRMLNSVQCVSSFRNQPCDFHQCVTIFETTKKYYSSDK